LSTIAPVKIIFIAGKPLSSDHTLEDAGNANNASNAGILECRNAVIHDKLPCYLFHFDFALCTLHFVPD